MVSKSQLKLITGLAHKKYRERHGLFAAEGPKVVGEFLHAGFRAPVIYATEAFTDFVPEVSLHRVSETELRTMSFLKSPQTVLALFEVPDFDSIPKGGLEIALDQIQDPGNLGTVIRLCDWFGINRLMCNHGTVDCYNPKVVQASMGSLARVKVHYTDLLEYLRQTPKMVYGTYMDGENVYATALEKEAILVLGNEGKGISSAFEKAIDQRIAIPRFGKSQETESLNVATATAIFLSEFKRR